MRIEIKEQDILRNIISKRLRIDFNAPINGISIDSRKVNKGDLFLAMKGEKCHGADFIDFDIVEKSTLIVSDKYIDNPKTILVNNSKDFLKNIASDFRKNLKMKIIGITGTNGKTSTKELLVKFLKTKFKVNYSKGNYNSTTSLPLSILGFDSKADYCVLEMGASKNDEIRYLCNIARPDMGIITNISESHLEGYKDFNSLIKTKMALYESVKNDSGTFYLNIDDQNINVEHTDSNIIAYSILDSSCNYFGDLTQINNGSIIINDYKFNVKYNSSIFGYNFLASYCIASSLGIDKVSIEKSLEDFSFPIGRGTIIKKKNSTIIDDTYNANLASMKSGIISLKEMQNKGASIVLILGDMLDLGKYAKRHHVDLGKYIDSLNFIDSVYCVGDFSKYIIQNINDSKMKLGYFEDVRSIITFLRQNKFENKVFYIKGSRGMHMDRIINEVF